MRIEFFTRVCSRSCHGCYGNWDNNKTLSEPYAHDGAPTLTCAEFFQNSMGLWVLASIDQEIAAYTQIVPIEEVKGIPQIVNNQPTWRKSILKASFIFSSLAMASYFKFHCWPKNTFTYLRNSLKKNKV